MRPIRRGVVCEMTARVTLTGGGRATPGGRFFFFSFPLSMTTNFGHAGVVASHAVNSLACFGEDKFVDAITAYFALEAVGMVGVVAGHNGFVEDRLLAYVTVVTAVRTDGGSIGEQEEIGIGGYLLVTLCALEAIDMEERLAECYD